MAQFRDAVITDKGIALIQKTQLQDIPLTFTKIVTGAGEYPETEELRSAAGLREPKQEFPLSSIRVVDESNIMLRFVISNQGLQQAYRMTEIGIFAEDPDEGDILYSLSVSYPGKADYMPAYNGVAPVTIGMDAYQSVSNAENVTIRADTGAYASAADLEDLRKLVMKKTGIVLMREEIPVAQREEKTVYLRITDRQTLTPEADSSIKVSSNMGIELADGSDATGLKASPYMGLKIV